MLKIKLLIYILVLEILIICYFENKNIVKEKKNETK